MGSGPATRVRANVALIRMTGLPEVPSCAVKSRPASNEMPMALR